jgi:hypothetical protein
MIQNSKASGLFLGLFFICSSVFAKVDGKLHIAVIDTGFCNKSPLVQKAIDLTDSVEINCKKVEKANSRFHGHFVLQTFLNKNRRKDLIITPLIVFDKDGLQKDKYWIKALSWIKKNRVDLILTASGLKVEKTLGELPRLTFAAAGQVSGKIRRYHKIFPQSFESQNLILIGNLLKEDKAIEYADNLLLHRDRIDYFVEDESSSHAVAKAMAMALNKCKFEDLPKCLESKSSEVSDQITKKTLQKL